jgi:uncharacterized protein (DUF427 family)
MSRSTGRWRAVWADTVVAESDDVVVVEGNAYFPRDSVSEGALTESSSWSVCPWKGIARYHSVVADGVVSPDGAWSYAHPTPLARRIRGRIAFWNGVRVERVRETSAPATD